MSNSMNCDTEKKLIGVTKTAFQAFLPKIIYYVWSLAKGFNVFCASAYESAQVGLHSI